MSRTCLSLIAPLACLLCACATPARLEQSVLQTTAPHRRVNLWEFDDTYYVRVAEGAPTAVMLAEPEPFADTLALLSFGQPLVLIRDAEWVGDAPGYAFMRTSGMGIDVEGWVWAAAVSRAIPTVYPPDHEQWEDRGQSYESPGLDSPEWRRSLQPVDDFEAAQRAMAGDSEILNRRFHEFGKQGALIVD